MKKYYKLLIVIGCFIIPSMLFASEKKSTNNLTAKIEIVMLDSSTFKQPSVEFKLYKEGMNTKYNMQISTTSGALTTGSKTFDIALSTPVNYGRIYLRHEKAGQTENILSFNTILFLFEAGDDIKIKVTRNAVVFTGKGSEKYNCAYRLSENSNISQLHFKKQPHSKLTLH